MKIFNLFGIKKENHEEPIKEDDKSAKKVLEKAESELIEIEKLAINIRTQVIYINLISFISYYCFIIDYYNEKVESIISVNELLALKYIEMVKQILQNFDEKIADHQQKEQLSSTLLTINEKLFNMVNDIKEKKDMNLNIDLKTMEDLVKLDF